MIILRKKLFSIVDGNSQQMQPQKKTLKDMWLEKQHRKEDQWKSFLGMNKQQ